MAIVTLSSIFIPLFAASAGDRRVPPTFFLICRRSIDRSRSASPKNEDDGRSASPRDRSRTYCSLPALCRHSRAASLRAPAAATPPRPVLR